MRRRLLRWLVCPECHGALRLAVKEEQPAHLVAEDREVLQGVAPLATTDEVDLDVTTGALLCEPCGVYYPIQAAVPRMLTYPTAVAWHHAKENASWLAAHAAGCRLPQSTPPLGEAAVLKTFSAEWSRYTWNGESYWSTTPQNMLQHKRYELGLSRRSIHHSLVLEVGIGIGGTADMLSRAEGCEIVGMDLGYAVDQAQHYFGANPRLHIVQASVFAPPFRPETFGTVYSHGVLHHTHSTRAAFDHLAPLPVRQGGMLYIWLYSHAQEKANPLRRGLMLVESLVRPVLARLPEAAQTAALLPAAPIYMCYQNLYRRRREGHGFTARYGWNEALHAARDRLTPPFAHRHSYDEVVAWFGSQGYGQVELLRDERLPEGVPDTLPLNVGVRGYRDSGDAVKGRASWV